VAKIIQDPVLLTTRATEERFAFNELVTRQPDAAVRAADKSSNMSRAAGQGICFKTEAKELSV